MLEGAPVAQTGPGFLTVPLLVAALVLQLEVGSHTLLILGILAAWLSSPGGLNIVQSTQMPNCGMKMMFLVKNKVCGVPKCRPETARLSLPREF